MPKHNSTMPVRSAGLDRRQFGKAAFSLLAGAASGPLAAPAFAQGTERELVFSARGGSIGNVFKTKIIPPFEQKFNCKVTMIVNDSGPALSKVLAERANPQTDVLWSVDPTHARGIANGLFEKLDLARVPNFERLHTFAQYKDQLGVPWGVGATILAYNKQIYDEKKLTPPTSWNDIVTTQTKGHIVWLDLSTQQGINTFLIVNKLNGGSETNVDPIFRFLKSNLSNMTIVSSPAQVDDHLQQKEAWIATNLDARFAILKSKGFPLELVYPNDGLPQQNAILNLVKGAPHPNLAHAFINWVIGDEVQTTVGNDIRLGPVNKHVRLDPKVEGTLVYGSEKIAKLVQFDQSVVTRDLSKWLDRWNRELA